MKHLFSYLTILFLLGFFLETIGQDRVVRGHQYDGIRQHLIGEAFYFEKKYTGEIFYLEDFVEGELILENGELYDNLQLKYCGATDEVLYFNEKAGWTISLDPEIIERFSLIIPEISRKITFEKIKVRIGFPAREKTVFAEVLNRSKLKLYVIRANEIIGTKSLHSGINTYYRDEFAPVPQYLIILPDERVIDFKKIRKRELYSIDPARKDVIRKLLNQNRLVRVRNESQLLRAIKLIEAELLR